MKQSNTRVQQAREALDSRLLELGELDRISAEGRAPVTLQQDSVGRLSRMDALQQQAMAQAEERRRAAEKSRIRAALQRLDADEWGWCLTCGEEIAAGRLERDPAAAQCLTCAEKR